MAPDRRIFWFDAIRGISAFLVCAGHLRAAMFCDYGEISSRSFWHLPFYFATSLGHQAVMVFFVLSGFFVGGSVLRERNRFSWSSYSIARLSRLWTVLIPALFFTGLVDLALSCFAPEVLSGAYSANWLSGPAPGTYAADAGTLLLNVVFLQTVLSPVYGSNGPLWSLANEFWYYAVFPLLVAVIFPKPRPASMLYGCAVVVLLWWLPSGLVHDGIIWLFGVAIYLLAKTRCCNNHRMINYAILPGLLAFFGSLCLSKSPTTQVWIPVSADVVIGISFAFLAVQLVSVSPNFGQRIEQATRWLSDISYTLYLFHFPIVALIGGWLLRGRQYQPGLITIFGYLTCLAGLVAISHIAWLPFERNTDKIRNSFKVVLAGLASKRTEL